MRSKNIKYNILFFYIFICLHLVPLIEVAYAEDSKIIVGVLEHWPPQYLVNEKTGQPDGFAVEIMNEIGRISNLKIEYKIYRTWPKLNKALKDNQIDVIPNMGITEERKPFFNFTAPLETTRILFFKRKTSTEINDVNDLQGKEVSVVETNKGRYLLEGKKWQKIKIYKSLEEALMSVLSGNSEALVYPDPPLKTILIKHGLEDRLETINPPLKEVKRGICTNKKEKDLAKKLNEAVISFLDSKKYQQIYSKWYGKKEELRITKELFFNIAGLVVFITILLVVWRFMSLSKINKQLMENQQALKRSDTRFNVAMDASQDGLYDWNLETNQIYYSPGWKRMLGYNDDELPNDFTVWEKLTEPLDVKRSWDMQQDLVNKKINRFKLEFKMKHKNGHWIDILSRAKALFNDQGKAVRIVGTHTDITERKKNELALKESDKMYRLLTENATDVIWVLDVEKNIFRYVSPSVKQLLGYTPEEVVQNGPAQLFVLSSLEYLESEVPKRLENYKMGERQVYIDVFEQKHKKGHIVLVEINAKYVRNLDTNRIEAVGVSRDITEKKQLEDRLRQSQKMESVGQLAGGIAHDFNNILYPIIGFAQLSQNELPKDHPVQENLIDILDGAKRARDLVKRILLFSRQKEAKLKPTILQPIIQESYKLLRQTIPSNINLLLDLYDGEDHVLCDTSEIHEIILNLCTNAYHAIVKDKGEITIGLKKDTSKQPMHLLPGEYLCLSVRDNGVGIPESIRDKIFEPYITTKDVGKGSGLGLSVVHGIVKNYKGDISVESDPGIGSEFKIYLPCTTQFDLKDKIKEKINVISGNDERILFVDDEDSIVKLGVRALENSGYQVTGINNSDGALTLFESKPDSFDLVITDMAMPNIIGSELAKRILEIRPGIPIIICSGYSEKLEREKAKNLKVSKFLDKPLSVEKLVKFTREVLHKQKSD